MLNLHREFSHANACGMVDRRSDGSGDSGQADLADPARANFVDLLVGKVQEVHLDRWRVSVDCHNIVGQVAVDRRAGLGIVTGMFEQCHADSHDDRAFDLVPAGQRIDDSSRVYTGYDTIDAQAANLRPPPYLDEMTSE